MKLTLSVIRADVGSVGGHIAPSSGLLEAVKGCVALGIDVLTLYTFSTENWNRPRSEIKALMAILRQTLRSERRELRENHVRLRIIGRAGDLPAEVVTAIEEAQIRL